MLVAVEKFEFSFSFVRFLSFIYWVICCCWAASESSNFYLFQIVEETSVEMKFLDRSRYYFFLEKCYSHVGVVVSNVC